MLEKGLDGILNEMAQSNDIKLSASNLFQKLLRNSDLAGMIVENNNDDVKDDGGNDMMPTLAQTTL